MESLNTVETAAERSPSNPNFIIGGERAAVRTSVRTVYDDTVLARAGGLRAVRSGLRPTRYRQGV